MILILSNYACQKEEQIYISPHDYIIGDWQKLPDGFVVYPEDDRFEFREDGTLKIIALKVHQPPGGPRTMYEVWSYTQWWFVEDEEVLVYPSTGGTVDSGTLYRDYSYELRDIRKFHFNTLEQNYVELEHKFYDSLGAHTHSIKMELERIE
jgi:hypothetical protein